MRKSKGVVLLFTACAAMFLYGCISHIRWNEPEVAMRARKERVEMRRAQDALEDLLGPELAGEDVQIRMEDRGLVVTLLDRVLFDSGKAKVKPTGGEVLGKVATVLNTEPGDILIEGHTDNQPIKYSGWKSNWELSTARATSVLHFFEAQGVPPERMVAVGYGEYKPVASNDAPEGRQKNRRVEIVLAPSASRRVETKAPAEEEMGAIVVEEEEIELEVVEPEMEMIK